jgi:iron complex transport system substrate-binding protein
MLKRLLVLSFIFVQVISCSNSKLDSEGNVLENNDAKGFEISKTKTGYVLQVKDPYQGSNGTVFSYSLSNNEEFDGSIKIPVKRVVCMSTSHVAMIDALGKSETICGISGADYIYNKNIRKRIVSNELVDVGYGDYMNAEQVIALAPDVVFAYGIDRQSLAPFDKLKKAGIPVVYIGEYLENHPLGRLEWIRFFSCFFDCAGQADLLYDSISLNYLQQSEDAKNSTIKPLVLTGMPWKGTWFVPGGNAYLSNMITDAGGTYIWKNLSGCESIPLSIETVFAEATEAQFWIHPNACKTQAEIVQTDNRFNDFRPISMAKIYNNNAQTTDKGGNDYWESGVVHIDVVLKDLIHIFHPELLPNHKLIYYTNINE